MEIPAEVWAALIAAIVGIVVRVISNARVKALHQVIDEKDELLEDSEHDLNDLRRENLALGRQRFRLRQRLAENGIEDPTECAGGKFLAAEEEHES